MLSTVMHCGKSLVGGNLTNCNGNQRSGCERKGGQKDLQNSWTQRHPLSTLALGKISTSQSESWVLYNCLCLPPLTVSSFTEGPEPRDTVHWHPCETVGRRGHICSDWLGKGYPDSFLFIREGTVICYMTPKDMLCSPLIGWNVQWNVQSGKELMIHLKFL